MLALLIGVYVLGIACTGYFIHYGKIMYERLHSYTAYGRWNDDSIILAFGSIFWPIYLLGRLGDFIVQKHTLKNLQKQVQKRLAREAEKGKTVSS
jgi:hypothetical protein